MKIRQESGATLLEVLMVAGVIGVLLTMLVSMTTTSISRNSEAERRTVATRLAQEGIEWSRAEKEELGWVQFDITFTPSNNNICLMDESVTIDSAMFLACGADDTFLVRKVDGKFKRNLEFNVGVAGLPDHYELTSSVSWQGQVGSNVELTTKLYRE